MKICQYRYCDEPIIKRKSDSNKYFGTRKYCSLDCGKKERKLIYHRTKEKQPGNFIEALKEHKETTKYSNCWLKKKYNAV